MKPPAARACVIMPALNEARRIATVVAAVLQENPDVLVVDDGSTDDTAGQARQAGAMVVRHEVNRGKGAALNTGFKYAREKGFDVVITMDSDGQHDPSEVAKFLEAYRRTGIPVLIGSRMANLRSMPTVRRWTNRFMSWLLSRWMGQYVADTQCGFRLYRCDVLPHVSAGSERFAAESEILLNLAHRGTRMDSVRISTIYGDESSKINPFADTIRFFHMLWQYRRRVPR